MQCPSCGKETAAVGVCEHCGTPLPAPSAAVEEELREIKAALTELAGRVRRLDERLLAAPVQPPAPSAAAARESGADGPVAAASGTAPAPFQGPRPIPIQGMRPAYETEGGTGAGESGLVLPASEEGRPPFDWEELIGRNWFAIIGSIALAIGIGFFLRLAFENQWIGTTERVLLGLACGLALLGIGQWAHGRYPAWAQAVSGGGVAVLYLSAYAAFGFYRLMGPVAALASLSAVVVVSGLLALRHESRAIALLGIIGAFLTPALLGNDLPSRMLFLAYILLIDAGIVGIATFRNWRWFTLLGLAGSYLLFAMWLDTIPSDERALAQVGLTGIFLLFVGATTLFHILWRREPGSLDISLMTVNAGAYYGVTFGLLWPAYEAWFGLLSVGLAGVYGAVAYAAKRRGAPGLVSLFGVAMAIVFVTVAVPLQLGGSWITVGWAAEGVALVWIGYRSGDWRLRTAGLGALAIGTGHLLLFERSVEMATFQPVLNIRFAMFAFVIVTWYAGAYLYHRGASGLREEETYNVVVLSLVANALTVGLLSAEAAAFFESRGRAGVFGFVEAHHYAYLTWTAIWTAYAAGLAGVGLARRLPALRAAAIGLLVVAVAKLALFDVTQIQLDAFRPLLNVRFLLFAFVVGACYGLAYLYGRGRSVQQAWERPTGLVLVMAANVLTLWILSAEAIAYFDSLRQAGTEQAKQLTLTVLWGVYAAGLISVGILRGVTAVRLAGAGLLVVTLAKLFGFDVFLLERGYRVAAFITLGVLLLATGFAYQRFSHAVKGFLLGSKAGSEHGPQPRNTQPAPDPIRGTHGNGASGRDLCGERSPRSRR